MSIALGKPHNTIAVFPQNFSDRSYGQHCCSLHPIFNVCTKLNDYNTAYMIVLIVVEGLCQSTSVHIIDDERKKRDAKLDLPSGDLLELTVINVQRIQL